MRRVFAAAVVAALAGAAFAQTEGKEPAKSPREVEVLRARAAETYFQRRGTEPPAAEVVYGQDDRRDVYEVSDSFLLDLAQAACVVVSVSELTDNGNGTFTLDTTPWLSQGGTLCSDEPFRGQLQLGFCSGFLVGSDLVATAGHCVDGSDVGSVAFVFGFDQRSETLGPLTTVPADNVYFVTQIVDHALGGEFDHSLVRVDRPVQGFHPVPVRRSGEIGLNEPLVMIGHPVVLPKKIDDGGQCMNPRVGGGWFNANVDAYGGNSGSMVVNLNTGQVEGILVRGNQDFTSSGGCVRSNVCPDSGCPDWEEISKVTTFAALIPPLGAQVSPLADQLHVGEVGGPFDNSPVIYTMSNPTNDDIDYRVSLSLGGAPILLDGGTGIITGTLGAGATEQFTVSLAASAGTLNAGVYTSTVLFEDLTSGTSEDRVHTVEVGQTGFVVTPDVDLVSGGPVGGPFTGTVAYTLTSTRPTPVTVRVQGSATWIGVNGSSSPLDVTLTGTGDSEVVVVGFTADADLLGNGLYFGSVTFMNLDGGAGTTSRDVVLDVGRFTYASIDTPLSISDHSSISSQIMVGDVLCVGDVNVEVDISHTYIGDLIVELVSPLGTVVRLHDRTGGSADNIVDTYDDSGRAPDGPGALADFNGQMASGLWRLNISDNAGQDVGMLNSWTLKIAGSVTCPPVAYSDEVRVDPNVTSTIDLAGASTEPTYSFVINSLPSSGTLSDPAGGMIMSTPYTLLNDGNSVRYRPNTGFVGDDAFTFSVFDGLSSNIAAVDVQVGGPQVIYSFPMDVNPGWTTQGQWAFGAPSGGGSNNHDPISGYTGLNVYGYNLGGDYTNNMSAMSLRTPALDLTNAVSTQLRFARWLAIESARWDHAGVEVSTNGASWTRIWDWTIESSVSPTAWEVVTYDIGSIADGQATVYIRWVMGPTDGSVTYPGWNIDDVEILGILPPDDVCQADLTGSSDPDSPDYGVPDGSVDASDFFYYLDQVAAGNLAIADMSSSSDPLDPGYGVPDGVVDAADFFYYLDQFAQGCP